MSHISPFTYLRKRTKLIRKRSLHRLKIWLRYLFLRKTKKPCLVLTARRCGSNFLIDCLNSVPGVSFASEILHRDMFYGIRHKHISRRALIRHILYSINACAHSVCGAKIVKYQINALRLSPKDLYSLWPDTRFILLYRRSLLEQYVSLKLAEMTREWLSLHPYSYNFKIRISETEFRNFCAQIHQFYGTLINDSALQGRMLVLSYEELASDPQIVFDTLIFPFLEIAPYPIKTRLVKQNLRSLPEIIENYEDIKHILTADWATQDYSETKATSQTAYRVPA